MDYIADIDGVQSFECDVRKKSHLIHKSRLYYHYDEKIGGGHLKNFWRWKQKNSKLFIIDKSNIWSCLFLLSAGFFLLFIHPEKKKSLAREK